MIGFLMIAGQWLGVAVFAYCACLVISCAAEELRDVPPNVDPLTAHDWDAWDAPARAARSAQRLDSR